MAYIRPPGPKDDEIAFENGPDGTPWTWGQVRALEKSIDQLEADDETVRAARQRLDETLEKYGLNLDPSPSEVFVCEHCGKPEYYNHGPECPDAKYDRPVIREAGAYQWLDENFSVVHQASVCVNDEEACDYFRIVQVWFPNVNVKYLMRRPIDSHTFTMRPWQYDRETGAVTPIERPQT